MADPSGKRKCVNCKFYEPGADRKSSDPKGGYCHRYAPKPNEESENDKVALWKIVDEDSWCGDFMKV
jgi:hypothetical protein